MAADRTELNIWIEGQDEPLEVVADQRDTAAFELEYRVGITRALNEMPMVWYRFIGWAAAVRTKKIPADTPRQQWLDTVIEVEPKPDEEPVNPGVPAA